MCAATMMALLANEAGAALFGKQASVLVAAVVIGVVGTLVGARLRRSALVFIVPGVLMLVPGSAGYNSVLQLVTDESISGIAAGFDTFITAISIAYGLMVSTVVMPRRFSRFARRPRPFPSPPPRLKRESRRASGLSSSPDDDPRGGSAS